VEDKFLNEHASSYFNVIVVNVNLRSQVGELSMDCLFYICKAFTFRRLAVAWSGREFEGFFILKMHVVVEMLRRLEALLIPLRITTSKTGHLDLMEFIRGTNIV